MQGVRSGYRLTATASGTDLLAVRFDERFCALHRPEYIRMHVGSDECVSGGVTTIGHRVAVVTWGDAMLSEDAQNHVHTFADDSALILVMRGRGDRILKPIGAINQQLHLRSAAHEVPVSDSRARRGGRGEGGACET